METLLLDWGFSYFLSKLMPYLLFIALGIIIAWILYRKTKKIIIPLLVAVLPFAIYFAINPIYQGDFSNVKTNLIKDSTLPDLQAKQFAVLAMPGCKYCLQAAIDLRELKLRNPKVQIRFIVTSTEEAHLQLYKEVVNGAFPVINAKDPQSLVNAAKGRFPTYALSTNKNTIYLWENNFFGVSAKDEIIAAFN